MWQQMAVAQGYYHTNVTACVQPCNQEAQLRHQGPPQCVINCHHASARQSQQGLSKSGSLHCIWQPLTHPCSVSDQQQLQKTAAWLQPVHLGPMHMRPSHTAAARPSTHACLRRHCATRSSLVLHAWTAHHAPPGELLQTPAGQHTIARCQ